MNENAKGRRRLVGLTVATVALVFLVVFGSRLLAPGQVTGTGAALPLWVLLPVAYLAGVLALLSPCSGAILPAFFAYSFDSKGNLLRMTYIFYLGLALVFVPVSGASSLVDAFVLSNQQLVFGIGGAVLIAFGLVALFGIDLGRLTARLGFEPSTFGQDKVASARTEDGKVYLMGAVFGFATSSCTAPILGSLVALSVSSGLSAVAGVLWFLVFALGIVTPLFVLALTFEETDVAQRVAGASPVELGVGRWRRAFHPAHLVTGSALIVLGVVFIVSRGTLALTEHYTRLGLIDAYEELNLALQSFFATGVGQAVAAGAGLALVAALLAWRASRQPSA
jgi:cytochrome c biogenesis protein CcdA